MVTMITAKAWLIKFVVTWSTAAMAAMNQA
jgi:hypothetical protein